MRAMTAGAPAPNGELPPLAPCLRRRWPRGMGLIKALRPASLARLRWPGRRRADRYGAGGKRSLRRRRWGEEALAMDERPEQIGPFRVIDALGEGGMGIVYRGEHPDTGQRVAIKTVRIASQGLLESLRREIHALTRARHPGVVRIVASGTHAGLPWYAMELIEGVTLRQFAASLADRAGTLEPAVPLGAPSTALGGGQPARPLTATAPHGLGSTAVNRSATSAGISATAASPGAHEATCATAASPGAPEATCAAVAPAAAGGSRAARFVPSASYLRGVLEVARRLCVPLSYLHGEGIVHRDLKPDNVLVGAGGRPIIVDFGLVTHFTAEVSREALMVQAGGAGTVSYMAPEQIAGKLVDARADLYALGCIVYELIVGRCPFTGQSSSEILRKHLGEVAAPPSCVAPGVPAPLDELLMRMLAKDPRKRLGYATDVAVAIGEILAGFSDGHGGETGVDPGPPSRLYLYRPGFSGRGAQVEVLREHVGRAEDGSGAVVLVGGESGVGKTRLVMEVAREAAAGEALVLAGECLDGSDRPLEAMRRPLQAIADRCRHRGAAQAAQVVGNHARVLARYEPSLFALPGLEAAPEPEVLSPQAARLRLYAALADVFGELACQQPPLVLVLDDLQWADGLTVGFLDFLLRGDALERSGILVIGTYRSEEAGAELARLLEHPRVNRVDLGRLDELAVAGIVGDMLALDRPPQGFVRFLTRHSEGNPFFAAEYLRVAVEDGVFSKNRRGRWELAAEEQEEAAAAARYAGLPLPSALREVVGRRLDALPAAARRLVDAAAVLGREVESAMAWALAELEEEELLAAVSEAIRRLVFEEAGPGRVRFAHDKLREVCYATLDGERRQELHAQAAQWLRAAHGEDAGALEAEVARHYDLGGEPGAARDAYGRAARRAKEQYANEEALSLYGRAIALWEAEGADVATEALGGLYRDRGEIAKLGADFGSARRDFERLGEVAVARGDERGRGDALALQADAAWRCGALADGAALASRAEAIGAAMGDWALRVAGMGSGAICAFLTGDTAGAIGTLEAALDLARRGGDRTTEMHAADNLAQALGLSGRASEAIPKLEAALAIVRTAAGRDRVASLLSSLGAARFQWGDLTRAIGCYRESAALAHSCGAIEREADVLNNLADVLVEDLDLDAALSAAVGAAGLARRMGDAGLEQRSILHQARALRLLGDLPGAADLARIALDLAVTTNFGEGRLFALAELCLQWVLLGDLLRASDMVGEIRAAIREDDPLSGAAALTQISPTAVSAGAAGLALELTDAAARLLCIVTSRRSELPWVKLIVPAVYASAYQAAPAPHKTDLACTGLAPHTGWSPRDWISWGRMEMTRLMALDPGWLEPRRLDHPDRPLGVLLRG
ncbi:MAG: protein kinase [Candidatus Schekmanbacteria bacterium]|nr:protein kinase [Candidatus Schekmanbacteria bacterium]